MMSGFDDKNILSYVGDGGDVGGQQTPGAVQRDGEQSSGEMNNLQGSVFHELDADEENNFARRLIMIIVWRQHQYSNLVVSFTGI